MKKPLVVTGTIILVAAIILYARPLPAVQAQATPPTITAAAQNDVQWPDYGQSAFGALGFGVVATNGDQKSVPIASIAKVVTALSILHAKPLQPGQQGPDITITAADAALYQKYVAEEGSVIPVNVGEQISEYQALQALLLPSANNIADTLANWAFGSQSAYLTYANSFVSGLGLSKTHLADASGFSPKSVSSAQDLVVLGQRLLSNPVLAGIVSQSTANLPIAGHVSNVNWLLGTDGVVGIKTGNTDQAGGCFLFAANQIVDGQALKVVGAILGAPDRDSAIRDSEPLIEGSGSNFQRVQIAKSGDVVGTYKDKWGGSSPVVVNQNVSTLAWQGTKPLVTVKLDKLNAPADAGKDVGTLNVLTGQKTQSIPVALGKKISSPSFLWRIFHI